MDAQAYLRKQGWRGSGHSLDHTNRGITRPLLVSKKVDVLGVGLNKHAAVSDQWWLRAFDAGLQALGTGKESALAQVQKHGVNRGGLYGRFVKGEGVAGTFGQSVESSTATSAVQSPKLEAIEVAEVTPLEGKGKKRKRDRKDKDERGKIPQKAARDGVCVAATDTDRNAIAKKDRKGKNIGSAAMGSKKAALYKKRAEEKGVSVEEYTQRRQAKYQDKKARKAKDGT